MSDVQQIKAAICRDHPLSGSTQLLAALRKFFETDDFCAHAFFKINENYALNAAKRRGKTSKQVEIGF
jgi:hypothetical protein